MILGGRWDDTGRLLDGLWCVWDDLGCFGTTWGRLCDDLTCLWGDLGHLWDDLGHLRDDLGAPL